MMSRQHDAAAHESRDGPDADQPAVGSPKFTRAARNTTISSKPSTIEARLRLIERGRRSASARAAPAIGLGGSGRRLQRRSRAHPVASAASAMASPTRVIDPVTTTARRGAARPPTRARSSRASSTRSNSTMTRSCADPRRRRSPASSSAGIGALRRRRRDDEVVHGRRERLDDARGVLVGEDADHGDDLVEVEVRRRAPRRAPAAPCGLCAASTMHASARCRRAAGDRARSTVASPSSTTSSVSGCAAAAEERLDGGDRDGGVLRLVRAVERQEQVVVAAGAARAR